MSSVVVVVGMVGLGGGDGARGLMFKVGEVAGSWVGGVLCYLIWFVSFDVSL